ncbi:hypothetical protein DRQ20_00160 [bacterium]|nr:MAG: hypothetical protein DRQ18_06680 [bacterium]RKZ27555.1 MAG: hypothetical protein DRQ20_00160 [bacterium]
MERYRKGFLYTALIIFLLSIKPLISLSLSGGEREFINVNTASREELTLIPGIGEVTAKRIVELRERKGRIRSLDELLEVKGIGPKKLEIIKKYAKCE